MSVRRWRDHRQVVVGILQRVRTGVRWRDLPERFGPWKTVPPSDRSEPSVVDRPQPRFPHGGHPRERVPERLPRRRERVPRVRRQRVVPFHARRTPYGAKRPRSAASRAPASSNCRRVGPYGPRSTV
ncbi:transposase [Streptomyces sp. NPDC002185]|uniref:transposase n=1 Tax=Streptomyces sp. NPDC002185 TaxID=3364636 RepID=UPI0036A749A5